MKSKDAPDNRSWYFTAYHNGKCLTGTVEGKTRSIARKRVKACLAELSKCLRDTILMPGAPRVHLAHWQDPDVLVCLEPEDDEEPGAEMDIPAPDPDEDEED